MLTYTIVTLAVETLLPASGSRSNYSHDFFVDAPRSSRYVAHLRYVCNNFVLADAYLGSIHRSSPITTVLRVLAFTDHQSFPAYDRRISELM